MAPLEGRWFEGSSGIIPGPIVTNLVVASFGYPVAATLGQNGWDGNLMAGIGLELAPDNLSVSRGQVVMRGSLSAESATFQAYKLWESADKEVMVDLTFPSAAEFDFAAGRMHSDYLACEGIRVVASKEGRAILPTDWERFGLKKFCLRLFLNLAKPSIHTNQKPGVKFTMLFFPHTVEEMSEWTDLVQEVGCSGIKLLEGEAQLFPQAQAGSWGCPILPLICPGSRFGQLPILPTAPEPRHVIWRIVDTARQPNAYASHSTVKRKWGKIIADPDEYQEREPMVVWPQAPEPTTNSGKLSVLFITLTTP